MPPDAAAQAAVDVFCLGELEYVLGLPAMAGPITWTGEDFAYAGMGHKGAICLDEVSPTDPNHRQQEAVPRIVHEIVLQVSKCDHCVP